MTDIQFDTAERKAIRDEAKRKAGFGKVYEKGPVTIQRDTVRNIIRAMNAPKLADPVPPVEPPAPVLLAKPRVHHLVTWRNDGEVRKTAHDTRERAFAAGRALHYAIVWKWAVMDGRDMIHRELMEDK